MVASHISVLIYYITSQNHPSDKCDTSWLVLGWHLWLGLLHHLRIRVVLRLYLRWHLRLQVVFRHGQWWHLGFWLILWLGKRQHLVFQLVLYLGQ
jgi:hypothetical protein